MYKRLQMYSLKFKIKVENKKKQKKTLIQYCTYVYSYCTLYKLGQLQDFHYFHICSTLLACTYKMYCILKSIKSKKKYIIKYWQSSKIHCNQRWITLTAIFHITAIIHYKILQGLKLACAYSHMVPKI